MKSFFTNWFFWIILVELIWFVSWTSDTCQLKHSCEPENLIYTLLLKILYYTHRAEISTDSLLIWVHYDQHQSQHCQSGLLQVNEETNSHSVEPQKQPRWWQTTMFCWVEIIFWCEIFSQETEMWWPQRCVLDPDLSHARETLVTVFLCLPHHQTEGWHIKNIYSIKLLFFLHQKVDKCWQSQWTEDGQSGPHIIHQSQPCSQERWTVQSWSGVTQFWQQQWSGGDAGEVQSSAELVHQCSSVWESSSTTSENSSSNRVSQWFGDLPTQNPAKPQSAEHVPSSKSAVSAKFSQNASNSISRQFQSNSESSFWTIGTHYTTTTICQHQTTAGCQCSCRHEVQHQLTCSE